MKTGILSFIILFNLGLNIFSQDSVSVRPDNIIDPVWSGFVRAGFYSWINRTDNGPSVSSGFSDLGIRMEAGNGANFNVFADLRYRYGSEFMKPVSRFDFREGYIKIYGKKWNISAGQKIVKWGRCDFTNPVSKLSPQNLVSRSPDREDIDMGNLLSSFSWHPGDHIELEAVILPFYRPSTLIIDPVPLPENTVINKTGNLLTEKGMSGYGLRSDFHLKGFDFGFSWFNGYDPLPGISLSRFTLDLTQPVPVPYTELAMKPYKIRVLGFDFETTAGSYGLRGELAWSSPSLSYKSYEYVPMPEIKWVGGIDRSSGIWHFTAEYSGKYITGFTSLSAEPIIGSNNDFSNLAELLAIPGFDLTGYVRQEVGAFNRLYNYQIERYYHNAGIRIEAEMNYSRLIPSIFGMYNITSRDLLLIPEIKYKPSDGLTIIAGAEIYTGKKGSLYDIINDFMSSAYFSVRVDF